MKARTGDPWMPADRYGRGLPAFTVNLLVRDIARAVEFHTQVLAAKVHYSDPDGYLWAVGVPTPPIPGS
jgi:hypothetical protein